MSNDRSDSDAPKAATPDTGGAGIDRAGAERAGTHPAGGEANESGLAASARSASDPAKSSVFSREAVGFWFLALGVLGLVRSWMRATRHGAFDADAITLLWLIGSALLTLMGALRVWRSLRGGAPGN